MEEVVLPVSESFIIALVGGVSATFALLLSCLLKSRCYRVRICCIECDRAVIPSTELNNVSLERRVNLSNNREIT